MAIPTLNGISFCAGIGGLELGLTRAIGRAYRTVCVVERDVHAAATLVARMQEGSICDAPIWSDVKTFDPKPWAGLVDIITAGYPCQPFSLAGKRKGEEDPRHLWPYIAGHIGCLRPQFVFCENVSGHLSMGFKQVCEDLRAMGYRVAAGIFTALEVGAHHERKRLFFVANTNNVGCARQRPSPAFLVRRQEHPTTFGDDLRKQLVGNSGTPRSDTAGPKECAWPPEPSVGRMADGVPSGLDRLRALGNAVVPPVAAHAWLTLTNALMSENPT